MPYHHELSYESGPDIMWFHGAEPVLRDLNLTEDEALKLLSTVHEDEWIGHYVYGHLAAHSVCLSLSFYCTWPITLNT
ncbi:unnamed protein product [Bursaphelenchus okinawaensis]|uniref:Uncharacterized protein n=1 Tax=Bursaphelenchus okinawaensis TaxID=465554 RepID=A0A811KYN9_9BILA|nr:unnamed protein product [Bursaphelenchus okinawaensis]CAG9114005.1 unnamed protein product [Bursaphelenchus okinawaensis]